MIRGKAIIKANSQYAQLKGSTYDVGMSLTHILSKIYAEFGIEAGQNLIDEAQNLALKSELV